MFNSTLNQETAEHGEQLAKKTWRQDTSNYTKKYWTDLNGSYSS